MHCQFIFPSEISKRETIQSHFSIVTHKLSEKATIQRYSTTQKKLQSVINVDSTLGQVLKSSDIVPKIYEGGFTLWNCSAELSKVVSQHDLSGLRILEAGCGHGLPGITALLQGALQVDFLDFNEDVLRLATIPNVELNENGKLLLNRSRFICGDWQFLPELIDKQYYDVELSAETVYRQENFAYLEQIMNLLLKKKIKSNLQQSIVSLNTPCALFAGKSTYFGIDGGIESFRRYVSSRHTEDFQYKVEQIWLSDQNDEEIVSFTKEPM
ncbi:MAG: hypothetical protein EZS28_021473 [Streblomastix strix]|uniref:protein-histidine N-methyltransferase n=1 Tax=Streblomastix strix TaxID=222440 RepID=A0A5J4VK94_9EUKA|nr:MAG: hypothetical protein EZS28_021473 [Streblomastix strix]